MLAPSARTFQISDNDSPVPRDRLYATFNYFNDVPFSSFDVYRYTIGFEKLIPLDDLTDLGFGTFSVGMRLPLNNVSGAGGDVSNNTSSTALGDLTTIFKYAFYQDGGNLMSAGLAITFPTGPDAFAGNPNLSTFHSTLFQPFTGFFWRPVDNWFLHGFLSAQVPTDSRDVTLLLSDIGVGYSLYRNTARGATISYIVPTIETHVITPLNYRNNFHGFEGVPDIVAVTGGVTVGLFRRLSLSTGLCTPLTGPGPSTWKPSAT